MALSPTLLASALLAACAIAASAPRGQAQLLETPRPPPPPLASPLLPSSPPPWLGALLAAAVAAALPAPSRSRAALTAAVLLLVATGAAPRCAAVAHSQAERQASLEALFESIDANRDGQIDAGETERFAAASLDLRQEGWDARAAVAASAHALDGPDSGATVSRAELAAHLTALLQDHRVEEWVAHGLNLPQHAAAFRRAAITALDFPFLLADGGASLAGDLGVASALHRQQILRGLKRLVLGLGELPGAPRRLACAAANASALRLAWAPPEAPGHPPLHKYVLQRQRLAGGGGGGGAAGGCERWEVVGEPDDEEASWVDLPPAAGRYRYRLAAWSSFGRSPYAVSGAARVAKAARRPPHAPAAAPLAPPEVRALLAAVAAGANLTAGGGGGRGGGDGGGGVWSWSAASSAAVVALTMLLKASQLRAGAALLALWRRAAARLRQPGPAQEPGGGGDGAEQRQRPGLVRPASSQALLAAGLAAAGEESPPLLPGRASSGMLRSVSSSQLLAGGEASLGQLGSAQAEGSGWDCYGGEEADEAAEQLQQAVQRGARCAHPGCHRRFDRLRDVRRKLESHYCGLCQRVYCLQHTRASPHGARGGCGLESQCVCHGCFAELAPAQQAACERTNRLPRAGAPVAEPAGEAAAGAADTPGGVSGVGGGVEARRRWRKAGAVLRALARFQQAGSKPSSPS